MNFLLSLMILFSTLSFAQETEFDKTVEKLKKENLSEEAKRKLESKPEITPNGLKNERLKRKQGLIDPLIDTAKEASDEGKKKIETVTGEILRSEDLRDESFGAVALGYQPFTTWIPSKWTASYTQIFSRYWSLEGEYSRGSLSIPVYSVDIGRITEERVTLQARYYPGSSFNWSFGLLYQKGEAELGADIPATACSFPVFLRISITEVATAFFQMASSPSFVGW